MLAWIHDIYGWLHCMSEILKHELGVDVIIFCAVELENEKRSLSHGGCRRSRAHGAARCIVVRLEVHVSVSVECHLRKQAILGHARHDDEAIAMTLGDRCPGLATRDVRKLEICIDVCEEEEGARGGQRGKAGIERRIKVLRRDAARGTQKQTHRRRIRRNKL